MVNGQWSGCPPLTSLAFGEWMGVRFSAVSSQSVQLRTQDRLMSLSKDPFEPWKSPGAGGGGLPPLSPFERIPFVGGFEGDGSASFFAPKLGASIFYLFFFQEGAWVPFATPHPNKLPHFICL